MQNNSFFSNFSSKQTFFLGIGGTITIFFVIGFFVLLGIVLKGEAGESDTVTRGTSTTVSPTPSVPSPTPSPSGPSGEVGAMAPISDKDWIKGNRKADVFVVEYSDTECPFCKRVHPTLQRVVDEYKGKVAWVYRHFPLTSIHPKAPKEAEATECAGELGGNDVFWKYLDRLFEVTPSNNGLDSAELPKIAEFVGLNKSKFEECLNSGKYAQKVKEQADDAIAAGGQGTPYNIIVAGDQKIPISGAVPFEQFKAAIDSLL